MAKRHVVNVCVDFTHKYAVGALVAGGQEVSPAEERQTKYVAGTKLQFRNKADAVAFCKFHGFERGQKYGVFDAEGIAGQIL